MLINTICEHIAKRIEAGELQNEDLVQLIELIGSYLNLMTIANYARQHNISYNGAKKFRQVADIFGVKFIIDNR